VPDEIQAEIDRLRQLLLMTLRLLGISFKEIESRHNISHGYFSRVFSGKMDLRLEHIFQFCAYTGLRPGEFFQLAYPARNEDPSAAANKLRQALQLFPGKDIEDAEDAETAPEVALSPEQLEQLLGRIEEMVRREIRGAQEATAPTAVKAVAEKRR
jgi:transcriptional regulator with XRE-family HTH domain